MMEEFWLTAADDCELYIRSWGSDIKDAKAVIIISHGMTEHIARYKELAAFFNRNGFIVYGDDHRGHGRTGEKQGQLGFIAEANGFELLVEDLHLLIQYVKKQHKGLPIFIYGHSMGSFITRNFIQKYSEEVAGVLLAGSGFFPERSSKVGLEIASLQNPRNKSTFMNNLIFGNYNSKIAQKLTSFDWLTRDRQVVEDYIADPLSGYIPTAGFFVDLLTGILQMQDPKCNKQIRKDLPIAFISGEADPVGNYSKGVFQAAESYTEAGLSDVLVTIYPDARHELHQEINKEDVFDFLHQWIKKQL